MGSAEGTDAHRPRSRSTSTTPATRCTAISSSRCLTPITTSAAFCRSTSMMRPAASQNPFSAASVKTSERAYVPVGGPKADIRKEHRALPLKAVLAFARQIRDHRAAAGLGWARPPGTSRLPASRIVYEYFNWERMIDHVDAVVPVVLVRLEHTARILGAGEGRGVHRL